MDANQLAGFEDQMQASAEDLWPETVTIGGTPYACAAVVSGQQAELMDGGIGRIKSLTVTIRKSVLAALPQKGASIVHAGETYRFDEDLSGRGSGAISWEFVAIQWPG
ncbi:MAG: hypothetical protein QM496_01965 [Verrucomicrobiota bacterium]